MSKVALVTGGSRGIGFGIAEKLAAEKWNLVINGMRPEADVAEPLAKLRAAGVRVGYAQGDIATAEGRAAIIAATHKFVAAWRSEIGDGSSNSELRASNSINLLVNNAGVAPRVRADLLEMSEESYDRVLDTNLKGAFFLTQAVVNDMLAAKEKDAAFSGMIVNITSVSATLVSVNRGEYCIAKAGFGMMSQLFAARLGAAGIPVYEVRPGVIKTDMTAGVTEKYDKLIADGLFVQPRWGFPEDIGKAVAALARGDLPYSTGQVIMVDGGMTIPRL
jgi:NAD(P)-dependent dehydrogenase (short-subunit alcohol dehydrogenase family)